MSDSNRVALRYVEENTPGVTPATPKFRPLRITGAPSLGFKPKTIVSEELRDDRQLSDLMFVGGEAGGEVPYELSPESHDDMLAYTMFDSWQERAYRRNDKGTAQITAIVTGGSQAFTITNTATTGSITVDFAASDSSITRATGSFIIDGFRPGMTVDITGAVDAGNNARFVLNTVTATKMTVFGVIADEAADTGVTVQQVFAATDIVRAEGFGTANDGFHYADVSGTSTSLRVQADTTLVAQASIPTAAKLRACGARAALSDVAATANVGGQATLTCTALNFLTLGLEPGDRIKLRNFATAVNNDYVRVRSVTATVLTVDLLPAGWAADTGSGVRIEIYLPERVKNGVTKKSVTLEEEFADHTPVTFNYLRGMTPNTVTLLEGGSQEVMKGQITFLGFDQEYTDANTADKTATAKRPALDAVTGRIISATTLIAPTTVPFNTAGNVKRITFGGAVLTQNLVFEASIEIDNGLRPRNAWGAEGAISIGTGEFAVSGNLQTYFDSRSLVESVTKNTETSLDFRFEDGDRHALYVDLPRVKLEEGQPEVPGKNTDAVANLSYRALVSATYGYTAKLLRFAGVR